VEVARFEESQASARESAELRDDLETRKAMDRHRPVPILILTPRPDGEVGLILRDDFLLGVGILDGQVTGVTRKENCSDRAFRTATDGYHFGDVTEMILDPTSAVKAGKLGLLDYRIEITEISEAKHSGKSASRQNARIAGGHLWANE
jgi:hypothetical protein